MSEIAHRTPQQELIAQVRGDDFQKQIALALPPNIAPGYFVRVTVTALMQSPEIADCDPASVFHALIKCAQDGLLPDGRQAAIAPFNDRNSGTKKAQYLPMISGLRAKVAEFGWSLRTRVVYSNDEFSYEYGLDQTLTHRPPPPGVARGERVGAYAVASHRDGRKEFTFMDADAIAKVRAVSKSSNVWDQWPDQMWEKSAGKQLVADLPLDPSDKTRIEQFVQRMTAAEEFEPGEARDLLYGPSGHPAEVREIEAAPTPAASDSSPSSEVEKPEAAPALETPAAPTLDVDDEARMLADEAGMFVPPSGTYSATGPKGPMTLAAMAADENGRKYLGMLLKRLEPTLENQEYVEAVWAFCRVYCPELVQAAEVQS